MHIRKQSGFTLIELIVVISILGILAAFAVPKFISMETNARASTIRGVAGAIRSASSLAHALYVANGSSGASVTMEGTTVAITQGYPSVVGIKAALNLADITEASGTYTVTGHSNTGNCKVVYAVATATAPPTITVDVSDCS